MINITNRQRTYPINEDVISLQVAKMLSFLGYDDFDIGILITTNESIRKFNSTFRHKDKATDILSFPFYPELQPGERIEAVDEDEKNLGDLIISAKYVFNTCHKWDRDFDTHMTALLAHGIAHLLGHDHIEDEEYEIMQKLENKLIKAAG